MSKKKDLEKLSSTEYLEYKLKNALMQYDAETIWIVWDSRKNILLLEHEENGDYTTIESYAGSFQYDQRNEYEKIAQKYGVRISQ